MMVSKITLQNPAGNPISSNSPTPGRWAGSWWDRAKSAWKIKLLVPRQRPCHDQLLVRHMARDQGVDAWGQAPCRQRLHLVAAEPGVGLHDGAQGQVRHLADVGEVHIGDEVAQPHQRAQLLHHLLAGRLQLQGHAPGNQILGQLRAQTPAFDALGDRRADDAPAEELGRGAGEAGDELAQVAVAGRRRGGHSGGRARTSPAARRRTSCSAPRPRPG